MERALLLSFGYFANSKVVLVKLMCFFFFYTSENDILGIIYSLFGGR